MKYLLLLFMTFFSIASLGNGSCQKIIEKIDREKVYFTAPLETYEVIGKDRLYFYSVPNKQCKISNNLFIITHDIVIPYFEYNNYYYVGYMKNLNVAGWVEKSRLKSTGKYINSLSD